MKTRSPLLWIAAGLLVLLIVAAFFLWQRWDFVPPPAEDTVSAEARKDSIEQAKWDAVGDSLWLLNMDLQAYRDSLEIARKSVHTRVNETHRALGNAPLGVLVGTLDSIPTQ